MCLRIETEIADGDDGIKGNGAFVAGVNDDGVEIDFGDFRMRLDEGAERGEDLRGRGTLTGGEPRNPRKSAAERSVCNSSTISSTERSGGRRRTSRAASARTPPKPARRIGPQSGSLRAPRMSSIPFRHHALDENAIEREAGPRCLNVGVQRSPCGGKIALRRDAEDDAAGIAFVREFGGLCLEHYGEADGADDVRGFVESLCQTAWRNGNSKLLQDLFGAIFDEHSSIETILSLGLARCGKLREREIAPRAVMRASARRARSGEGKQGTPR